LFKILLIDFQSLSSKNEGFRYMLVAVDVLSRRVFGTPIKSKSSIDMKKAFDEIFKQMPMEPQRVFTDQGMTYFNYYYYLNLKEKNLNLMK